MNFEAFSQHYKPLIESALYTYLKVEYPDSRQLLADAILYSATAKAKRVRPLLCLASGLMYKEEVLPLMPLACGIEMVHAYSLIHDDLPAMDNDDYRRGQLTCHKKFGEDIAILAGDVLITYAFELISARLSPPYAPGKVLELIRRLAVSFGSAGMAGGQVLDLKVSPRDFNLEALKQIHSLKTGAVITASLVLPAFLEDAPAEELAGLTTFGDHLGLLFQITDDILDVVGTSEEIGKSPQKDIQQNKLTYVTLLGLEAANDYARSEAESALDALRGLRRNTTILEGIVHYITMRTT